MTTPSILRTPENAERIESIGHIEHAGSPANPECPEAAGHRHSDRSDRGDDRSGPDRLLGRLLLIRRRIDRRALLVDVGSESSALDTLVDQHKQRNPDASVDEIAVVGGGAPRRT